MVCFMSLVVLKPYPLIIKVLQAQYLDFFKNPDFPEIVDFWAGWNQNVLISGLSQDNPR